MCVYELTVLHTSLCASPMFPQITSDIKASQRNSEEWYMELSEDNEGRVGCIAHSMAHQTALTLLAFTLELHQRGKGVSAWNALSLDEPVVRGAKRQRLHPAELNRSPGESFHAGVVNSSSVFQGSLESLEAWSLQPPIG
eukprot:TRINITY_DN7136_c0_g1_i3.p2 TRINITY_DN7136_c0_g1~~TRINITY_DN7136_c0_g1_i3.p2  ORF type:complete len:140 (+),score=34.65 TRINITY_DN7136_c0_g1_i3:745-1164(+)